MLLIVDSSLTIESVKTRVCLLSTINKKSNYKTCGAENNNYFAFS